MLYFVALYLIRALLWFRCSLRIEGLEHVPRNGGGFLVSNHRSALDPIIIGASISKRQIRFMAKKELFQNWALRSIIQKLGAFPVDREFTDKRFIRQVCQYLEEKEDLILIFGEGTRNLDFNKALMPLKSGFAFLAKRAEVVIIPMYVSGIRQLFRPVLRPKLFISFGSPLSVSDIRNTVRETHEIMTQMAENHRQKLNATTFA